MKIRLAIFVFAAVFLLSGCVSTSGPDTQTSANIYQSGQAPSIYFFPKALARWDGYKITNKDWNQLAEYQKLMFILEGIKELERKEAVTIMIKDSLRTITALDYGVNRINKEVPGTQISMISFMYDVFKEAKMVAPRKVKKGGENELRKL